LRGQTARNVGQNRRSGAKKDWANLPIAATLKWLMATGTTVRQRQEEQRKEKLREIRRQIKEGSLVVRKMTKKELAEAERRFQRRK
jgi:hypothetical protein